MRSNPQKADMQITTMSIDLSGWNTVPTGLSTDYQSYRGYNIEIKEERKNSLPSDIAALTLHETEISIPSENISADYKEKQEAKKKRKDDIHAIKEQAGKRLQNYGTIFIYFDPTKTESWQKAQDAIQRLGANQEIAKKCTLIPLITAETNEDNISEVLKKAEQMSKNNMINFSSFHYDKRQDQDREILDKLVLEAAVGNSNAKKLNQLWSAEEYSLFTKKGLTYDNLLANTIQTLRDNIDNCKKKTSNHFEKNEIDLVQKKCDAITADTSVSSEKKLRDAIKYIISETEQTHSQHRKSFLGFLSITSSPLERTLDKTLVDITKKGVPQKLVDEVRAEYRREKQQPIPKLKQ